MSLKATVSWGAGFGVAGGSSVFCSVCVCVCEVECVCTACINSMCMPHYVHNVIPGIPCFLCKEESLVNSVMTNSSTKGISSLHVSKPSCKSCSPSLSLRLALAFCYQRCSDIHGSYKSISNCFFNKTHPSTTFYLSFFTLRSVSQFHKIGPSLDCLSWIQYGKMVKLHVVVFPFLPSKIHKLC